MLNLVRFKVAVPKIKPKPSTGVKRESNKIVRGTVFQDEEGNYKVSITLNSDTLHPDLLVLDFTERSYELKGRTSVFCRELDSTGRRVRIIRNDFISRVMPGNPERYIPFAPHWIIKGYIVKDNGITKFDFKDIVSIEGYDIIQHNEE